MDSENTLEIRNGIKIGKLTVLEKSSTKTNRLYWKVQCECGKIFETSDSNLRTGRSSQCIACRP